ncbi:hypothetical protein M407DRAFT_98685 [Tulasnella calospora MUT 4182]|uniref:EF-hand domain-containing protein n=1 Tax=Tulasnella calospora MUT 4182 TaxID=1051891 RepID=A0A0C3PM86_9AGAM|nr:hypothetical protein M407DRAFT_98685 [Tulasnella calospora MUT 4182]
MSGIPVTPSHNAKYPSEDPTALQQHVAWWDKDNDGVIWPSDIYHGFRALGFGILLSVVSSIVICLSLSYPSGSTWYPDWAGRIWIGGIHKAKHGSDSDVYNRKGVFDERAFEEIFSTYADHPNYDSLTPAQLFKLIKGNADPYDFFGWQANFLEWASFYVLLWPEDGRITKAQLQALYDGSLFPQIAKKVEARRLKAREFLGELKDK